MWETISKFGLKYCDLPTMIWNVAVMLRLLILNIDSRNDKSIPIAFYIIFLAVATCYFYVYLLSVVWSIATRYPEDMDLLVVLIIFSLAISSEIGTVKLMFMYLHIKKVKEIVEKCLECDSAVIPGTRFFDNLLSTLKLVKKRTLMFWFVIIGNGLVYTIKPFLLPGRHLMEDEMVLYGLEPMYETPNYQIAFLLMIMGVIWTCFLPANITAFLIVVTGYVEAQMLALSQELLHLWDDAQDNFNKTKANAAQKDQHVDKNKNINEYIKKHLIKIIQMHAKNQNLMKDIETVYKGAIAIEFFILGVGLIAELLGGLENTYIEMPFALMQVGMDCFVGQRVMDASIVFERALYDCKWENYSVTNMKIVLTMLQSSQKRLQISAGGIAMLNFSCMMQVIRSIYSGYTALRSTMD